MTTLDYNDLWNCKINVILALAYLISTFNSKVSTYESIIPVILHYITLYPVILQDGSLVHLCTVHSGPLFRSLHWLPVRFTILFKISLLTYKTLYGKLHAFLHFMLAVSFPSRSLRLDKGISLSEPWVKTNPGTRCKSFTLLCSVSLQQPPAVCPCSHFSCYLQETSEDTSL